MCPIAFRQFAPFDGDKLEDFLLLDGLVARQEILPNRVGKAHERGLGVLGLLRHLGVGGTLPCGRVVGNILLRAKNLYRKVRISKQVKNTLDIEARDRMLSLIAFLF